MGQDSWTLALLVASAVLLSLPFIRLALALLMAALELSFDLLLVLLEALVWFGQVVAWLLAETVVLALRAVRWLLERGWGLAVWGVQSVGARVRPQPVGARDAAGTMSFRTLVFDRPVMCATTGAAEPVSEGDVRPLSGRGQRPPVEFLPSGQRPEFDFVTPGQRAGGDFLTRTEDVTPPAPAAGQRAPGGPEFITPGQTPEPSGLILACAVCGRSVAKAPRGRPPRYCSRACQQKAYRARHRNAPRA